MEREERWKEKEKEKEKKRKRNDFGLKWRIIKII